MSSSLTLDQKVFDPASISDDTHKLNNQLMDIAASGPPWFEVGAPAYRQMRKEGKTPFPPPTFLPSASDFTIPSRDPTRPIPCRLLKPTNQPTPPAAIFLHMHGGGWVLGDEKSQDPFLQWLADTLSILCISIGYRLAPESPFPAGPNDCYDAVDWLASNAASHFHAPLCFIGGESAGAHLAMLCGLHILDAHENTSKSNIDLRGLVLHYGVFDLGLTPSVTLFHKPKTLILDQAIITAYVDAFLPSMTAEAKRDPAVSPLYADLQKLRGRLPAALFTCGTEDMLLDDTVFMSARYLMAGAEARVVIAPGGAHGFTHFPKDAKGSTSAIGLDAMEEFIRQKMR